MTNAHAGLLSADADSVQSGSVLSVRDLNVGITQRNGPPIPVVRDVSFEVARGEMVGLVGESGSGKSMTLLSIAGLVGDVVPSTVTGDVRIGGVNLSECSPEEARQMRGSEIGFVFQQPRAALNPTLRIGVQISEVIRAHERISQKEAQARAVEMLELVEIPRAAERALAYPHEFSGGMAQRAAIAMAIACRPRLLIADEPTTALDSRIQAEILALIDSLRRELGMGVLLVTHDLAVVRQCASAVAVMYNGRIVEQGSVADVFAQPAHPYTLSLMKASPALSDMFSAEKSEQATVGVEADAGNEPPGVDGDVTTPARSYETLDTRGTAALRVDNVTKSFSNRSSGLFSRSKAPVLAVKNVSFDVHDGEMLGLVGESGSGKTTLASLIMRLLAPETGSIAVGGRDIRTFSQRELLQLRGQVQMVFQDPRGSLNPRMSVGSIIAEPLKIRRVDHAEAQRQVARLLERVRLPQSFVHRFPHELSGGQQQRVGIARALILNPKVLILDEPTASLDVSIQAQILELLVELQSDLQMACVFISHDLALVRQICDRVAVMQHGELVELGPTNEIFDRPAHPYTASLVAASGVVRAG